MLTWSLNYEVIQYLRQLCFCLLVLLQHLLSISEFFRVYHSWFLFHQFLIHIFSRIQNTEKKCKSLTTTSLSSPFALTNFSFTLTTILFDSSIIRLYIKGSLDQHMQRTEHSMHLLCFWHPTLPLLSHPPLICPTFFVSPSFRLGKVWSHFRSCNTSSGELPLCWSLTVAQHRIWFLVASERQLSHSSWSVLSGVELDTVRCWCTSNLIDEALIKGSTVFIGVRELLQQWTIEHARTRVEC